MPPRAPVFAGLVSLAAVTSVAAIAGATDSLRRPLWLDEVFSQLVAYAPRGILPALRSGVDFQPPLIYFLQRLGGMVAGGVSPLADRLPSTVAAALTVLVLAATLRRQLSLASALAGALALSAHPLFNAQAFEGRPYALWILASLLTSESLRENRRFRIPLMAGAAIFLCNAHYFGIIALTAIAVSSAVHLRIHLKLSWPRVTRALFPLAAGGVALLLLLPLAAAQLATTGGRSWMSQPSASDVLAFLRFPWGWRPSALLIAAGVLTFAASRWPTLSRWLPRLPATVVDGPIVALLGTALVPVLVVGVTLFYKPVLALRYAAPAVLAVATLTALAVESFPRPIRWLAVLLLVRAANFSYSSAASGARNETAQLLADSRAVGVLARQGIPTVSPFRHDSYRVSLPANDAPSVAWLEVSDATIAKVGTAQLDGITPAMLTVERDFGRAVYREFSFPRVFTETELQSLPAVALMRDAAAAAADSLWVPGFRYRCSINARLVVYDAGRSPNTSYRERSCGSAYDSEKISR